ncbi:MULTISPECIES: hypothetical protein [unclassified Streptomyces]|uniref:hypothetical protein n=1 Tax=unclassified Streptomyces TaxID=2593676 RepID=UPI0011AD1CB3|nr:hypothetical protein [Streptomyces sp. BK340]TVZ93988.1 hypothetical protein FB157_10548 [Streptomyces sp. BK340]
MPQLPPIGAEIPCSMLAINSPLRIRTALVSVDFRGGIKHRIDVNPDDPVDSVRMRTIGFRISAELPSDDGHHGSIVIEQNDIDADPKSLLRLTQQFPPKYEHIMVLDFAMIVEQSGNGDEPLVLTTKDPAKLIGNLTQYPPRGDLYQLQNPVDLVDPDAPDTVVATLQKLPVKIGGL